MPTICCLIILLLGMRQALHHFRSTCHSVSQRLKNYDVASLTFRQYSIFSSDTFGMEEKLSSIDYSMMRNSLFPQQSVVVLGRHWGQNGKFRFPYNQGRVLTPWYNKDQHVRIVNLQNNFSSCLEFQNFKNVQYRC